MSRHTHDCLLLTSIECEFLSRLVIDAVKYRRALAGPELSQSEQDIVFNVLVAAGILPCPSDGVTPIHDSKLDVVDLKTAAKILGVCTRTLRRKIKNGRLPAFLDDRGAYLVNVEDLSV